MKRKKGTPLIALGLLLIAAALSLVAYNLKESQNARQFGAEVVDLMCETLYSEPAQKDTATIDAAEEVVLPDYLRDPEMEMPVQTIDGQDYIGVLSIPALNLELPVISQWSYPGLRVAPCRYQGSAYTDNLIIAAHNYSSHFGNLKTLREGDSIFFVDVRGNAFSYEVAALETLAPTATEEMASGDWDLTLFTCTVGGQSRVTLRCIRGK